MAAAKRSSLLSALFRQADLPAGKTVAETKADEDEAWRHRQSEIRREAFYRGTGRYPGGFV